MKTILKRSIAVSLTGLLAAGLLTGCGTASAKELNGEDIVATVNDDSMPMGVLSLYVREQQAYTESMYAYYYSSYGTDLDIWSTEVEDGYTAGDQIKDQVLEELETMYLEKQHAADYGVEITDEEQTAIDAAAAGFMEDNTEEAIKDIGCSEEHVKTFLELETYEQKVKKAIIADVDTEVSDDEANKSSYTYVLVPLDEAASETGEAVEDTETAEAAETDESAAAETSAALGDSMTGKEKAEEILSLMLADPSADMTEIASSIDESLTATAGSYVTNPDYDTDDSMAEDVLTALRSLTEDGTVYDGVIETDSGYYVVRLDQYYDEDATETNRENIISDREDTLYNDTTDGWTEEAEIKVDDDVLATLVVSDDHSYSIVSTADETETAEEETGSAVETSGSAIEEETAEETTQAE